MAREPYLVLRNFRVWFEKRRGFIEALRKTQPEYVRAVDGVDMDVGRGEIFGVVAGAAVLATLVPTVVSAGFFHLPFTDGWSLLGLAIVTGLLLAFFGSLPPTRANPRTAPILGLLSLVGFNLGAYLGVVLSGYLDPGAVYGSAYWGVEATAMLGGSLFGFIAATAVARVFLWTRLREEGLEGVKIRSL